MGLLRDSVTALHSRDSGETRLSLSLGSGWKLGEHLCAIIYNIQLYQHTVRMPNYLLNMHWPIFNEWIAAWSPQVREFHWRNLNIITLTWDFPLFLELTMGRSPGERVQDKKSKGRDRTRRSGPGKMEENCMNSTLHLANGIIRSNTKLNFIKQKLITVYGNHDYLPVCAHNFAVATVK